MIVANDWQDYELLDAGDGEKVERWGKYHLRRPDGQIIWPADKETRIWNKVDGLYHRSSSGGGSWKFFNELPERWIVKYDDLAFYVQPTGFKHMGLFPEQAVNWKWIRQIITKASRPVRVLNLFAYTGGATVAAASAGAEVCHVDAAKGMVKWAKENLEASGLRDRPVRFIVDDVKKFVQREQRRGRQYEGIIMDPPAYGRGPKGELWEIEKELYGLVDLCIGVLSEKPLFFLINSYTTGLSSYSLHNMLNLTMQKRYKGKVTNGEIGIPIQKSDLVLPCGIYGRWEEI